MSTITKIVGNHALKITHDTQHITLRVTTKMDLWTGTKTYSRIAYASSLFECLNQDDMTIYPNPDAKSGGYILKLPKSAISLHINEKHKFVKNLFHAIVRCTYENLCVSITFTTNDRVYEKTWNPILLSTSDKLYIEEINQATHSHCLRKLYNVLKQQNGWEYGTLLDTVLIVTCNSPLCKPFSFNLYLTKSLENKEDELAVTQDGLALWNVKHQTEKLCELAVQQNGLALNYVMNQTDKICELAVAQNVLALQHVMNQTEKICELAVTQNGMALQHVKNQTEKICELAVSQNGDALQYVKDQTEKICELAVSQNGWALKHVKTQTEKICELAVSQNGDALYYVKNQTEKICELAVMQEGEALEYVKDQTENICELAVRQNVWLLVYVKNQTEKLCELAVTLNGMTLQVVKHQTDKICELAVSQNADAIKFVKPSLEECIKMYEKRKKHIVMMKNLVKDYPTLKTSVEFWRPYFAAHNLTFNPDAPDFLQDVMLQATLERLKYRPIEFCKRCNKPSFGVDQCPACIRHCKNSLNELHFHTNDFKYALENFLPKGDLVIYTLLTPITISIDEYAKFINENEPIAIYLTAQCVTFVSDKRIGYMVLSTEEIEELLQNILG